MTGPSVVVLDYGSGNVRSAVRALERVGAEVELTADPGAVADADGLVVPGVGAFAHVMQALQAVGAPRLIERRLAGGRAVLGICVGHQVMFSSGVEHGTEVEGLDQWSGLVERLDAPVVPHMGWAEVEPARDSVLFDGVAQERFYFVHSYAARTAPEYVRTTWATHGETRFVAAVENGPLSATQFHHEKSGDAGAQLLSNWLGTL
ncbi:imidazole glycerol phosphate synthase subunit HisH [Pseudactinotalea sp.]|uniref:imidazole glycerol phosphate synthase subunit HisH n=1 Tax=Pseudactinotalea sp. TaxID=1926260 RepID=UPI003B3BBC2B